MSTGTTEREQGDAAPLGSERHMRADALRNRERILEAATTLMAIHGIDVPIDDIADLAQVGVGTVYRNFPTKGALFEALLLARITPLVAAARTAAAAEEPGEAFVAFVRNLCDEFADFKALADAMVESGCGPERHQELDLRRADRCRLAPPGAGSDVRPDQAGCEHQRRLGDDGRAQSRRSDVHGSIAAETVRRAGVRFAAGRRAQRAPAVRAGCVARRTRQDGLSVLLISQASRSMARCLPIGTCSDRSPPADRTLRSISHVPRSSRESRTSSTRMIACPLGDFFDHRSRRSTFGHGHPPALVVCSSRVTDPV